MDVLSGSLVVCDVPIMAVEQDEVLRYLGHRGQTLGAELDARLDAAMADAAALASPRAVLRAFPVERHEDEGLDLPAVRLSGCVLRLDGHDIARHLADATTVVVMAVTVGMAIERELQRLPLAGDTLGQLLLDAASTAVVERAADQLEACVVTAARAQGACVTTRYSPGYGDLPLDCQGPLLASIDATRRLGLTLTPSNLLVPTKSVTAVMGVGERVRRDSRGRCLACDQYETCPVRSTRACHSLKGEGAP